MKQYEELQMSYEIKQEVREVLVKKEFIEMSKDDFFEITGDIISICLEQVEETKHSEVWNVIREYLSEIGIIEVR